jgi:hypothetical protein
MRAQLAVYNSIFDPISDTTIANLIVEIYAKDHPGLSKARNTLYPESIYIKDIRVSCLTLLAYYHTFIYFVTI